MKEQSLWAHNPQMIVKPGSELDLLTALQSAKQDYLHLPQWHSHQNKYSLQFWSNTLCNFNEYSLQSAKLACAKQDYLHLPQ